MQDQHNVKFFVPDIDFIHRKEGVVGWKSEFTANGNQIHFVYLDRLLLPMPVSEYTLPADVPPDENACKGLPVRHGDYILLKKGTFVRGCSNHHLCLSAGNLSWKELEKSISWISVPAQLHIDRNNKNDSYIKLYDKSFFVKKDIIVKIKSPLHVTAALYLENRNNPTGRCYLGPWVPIKYERGKYIQEDKIFLNK